MIGAVILVTGCGRQQTTTFQSLTDQNTSVQLKSFVTEKGAQANAATNKMRPEFRKFFAAAQRGDWLTVSNMFRDLGSRNGQFERAANPDFDLRGTQWEAAKEIWGVFGGVFVGDEKYSAAFSKDIIDSIPAGSIYFGGTDPGRFLVTGMQKSHVNADPFFTLTQNALADGSYLDYLRAMYGQRIYTPTEEDSRKSFQSYIEDAQKRLQNNQLRPGEDVKIADGRVQASGQVAVMEINGLLAKIIFDQNKDREFYIEESFPLDWMYPYLEPHHLIMKINRQPLAELSDEVVQRDRDYWTKLVTPMIGNWLNEDTSVKTVAAFAEKVFLRRDFSDFNGDRRFVQNEYSHKMFSKERSAIGGLYAWRLGFQPNGRQTPPQYLPHSEAERQRMIKAADLAYRQSWALCPYSPEAVYRLVAFLTNQSRFEDATLVVDTAVKFPSDPQTKAQFQDLSNRLHQYREKK
jgi:hypothetical protein